LRQVLARVHFRVTLFAVALAGLTVLLTGIATIAAAAQNNLRLVAESASYTVAPALVFGDADAARESIAPLAAANGVAEIRVVASDGRVLATWQRPAQSGLSLARPLAALLFAEPVRAPILHQGRRIGEVLVSGDARDIAGYVSWGIAGAIGCLVVTAAAAHFLAHSLQRSVIEPLAAIAGVAHTVRTERAFGRRAPHAPIAEIDALGSDFNSLLAELDDWQHHLRREHERLSHRVAHDDLTGLPNRASFEQCLTSALVQARQDGQPFALLYLDGDGFKAVNDRYGHAAGDAVLMEIAVRLRACLRAGDVAARLGGDEFGLLLAAPSGREAIARVQLCLEERMGYPIRLPADAVVRVGLSVGSAVFPDDGGDAAALVNAADAEMYVAKQRAAR
jgi:diguanylate cyclase (GGDEF)-like protein